MIVYWHVVRHTPDHNYTYEQNIYIPHYQLFCDINMAPTFCLTNEQQFNVTNNNKNNYRNFLLYKLLISPAKSSTCS